MDKIKPFFNFLNKLLYSKSIQDKTILEIDVIKALILYLKTSAFRLQTSIIIKSIKSEILHERDKNMNTDQKQRKF